ncbi:UbiA prenyltransferase family protein [Nanoarchaeota archaeon]
MSRYFKEKISNFVSICRPEQYYKNLVIFLAIFFSGNIFNFDLIFLTLMGFFALSLMSSVNYILNDIYDRKRDLFSKDKLSKPIASGKISVTSGAIFALILFSFSIFLSYTINFHFMVSLLALFLLSTIYSMFLKNEIFIDLILISTNFVIRAVSGAYIIGVWVSPWLIIGTFFLAFFLATAKRKVEINILSDKATLFRPVLKKYSDQMLNAMLQINAGVLLLCYALYCFLGNNPELIISFPIVLYIVLRYIYLTYAGSPKVRSPEKIFSDVRITSGILLYKALTFLLLYL